MVTSMTNRLLATVIAVFLSGALTAHAAQDVRVTITPPVKPSTLPLVLHQVEATAQAAIDPSSAIRAAYRRDHDALEHLRQQGSGVQSPAHAQFNQLISTDQAQLLALEKAALDKLAAGTSVNAAATIAKMDAIPAQAAAALAQYQSQAAKTSGNGHKP
jgi:hypothetical protein